MRCSRGSFSRFSRCLRIPYCLDIRASPRDWDKRHTTGQQRRCFQRFLIRAVAPWRTSRRWSGLSATRPFLTTLQVSRLGAPASPPLAGGRDEGRGRGQVARHRPCPPQLGPGGPVPGRPRHSAPQHQEQVHDRQAHAVAQGTSANYVFLVDWRVKIQIIWHVLSWSAGHFKSTSEWVMLVEILSFLHFTQEMGELGLIPSSFPSYGFSKGAVSLETDGLVGCSLKGTMTWRSFDS